MASYRVALVVAAVIVWTARPVDARSCVRLDLCQLVSAADAVLEATVVGLEPHVRVEDDGRGIQVAYEDVWVRLRDVRAWVGRPDDVVVMFGGTGTAADGTVSIMPGASTYDFRIGARYVIFAYRRAFDGRLTTSNCAENHRIEDAGELLAYLASRSGPSQGGRLWGRLSVSRSPTPMPVVGARVVLQGVEERSTVTDAMGAFGFDTLPPGQYTVRADAPDDRPEMRVGEAQTVTLDGAHACSEIHFDAWFDGRLEGRVVKAGTGEPASGAFVQLKSLEPTDDPRDAHVWATTADASGAHEFDRLSPGRYTVGVSISYGPSGPEHFEPSHARHNGQQEIRLDAGAHLTLEPIVARRLPRVSIRGAILHPDGRPAADVGIVAVPIGVGPDVPHVFNARTNAQGQFTMEISADYRYRLRVQRDGRYEDYGDVLSAEAPILIRLH